MEKEVVVGLIAAGSALSGVLLSQFSSLLLSHFDRSHKRKVLLREKYEELVDHLNDSLVWANSVVSAKTRDELRAHTQPTSARKIYALVLLYFPLLKTESVDYLNACLEFQGVVSDSFKSNIDASAGAQAVRNNSERMSSAGEAFQKARQALDSKIEACSHVYISA